MPRDDRSAVAREKARRALFRDVFAEIRRRAVPCPGCGWPHWPEAHPDCERSDPPTWRDEGDAAIELSLEQLLEVWALVLRDEPQLSSMASELIAKERELERRRDAEAARAKAAATAGSRGGRERAARKRLRNAEWFAELEEIRAQRPGYSIGQFAKKLGKPASTVRSALKAHRERAGTK